MDESLTRDLASEVQLLRRRIEELTLQLEASDCEIGSWRTYSSVLRDRLKQYTDDLPSMPDERDLHRKAKAMRWDTCDSQDNAQVLGLKSLECSKCGEVDSDLDRLFAETGEVFCGQCWTAWERCGWWRPSIRISTVPPSVREPDVRPHYVGEDAFFLPAFLCKHADLALFEALQQEFPTGEHFSDWHGGRHLGLQFEGERSRHEGADEPLTLRKLVLRLEETFGIRASASRMNFYRSNQDYKPFHCDRGRDEEGTPQVTVGASFGATRELTLVHIRSGVTVSLPQRNGDVFCFTPELNSVFMHGIPKIGFGSPSEVEGNGPRLSLILWGSRVHK